jgi:hypothetical protein
MLNVSDVSDLLDVSVQQIYNYIKNDKLKATISHGEYRISTKVFLNFRDNYFYNRSKSKKNAIPTNMDFFTLEQFVKDIKSEKIPFEAFLVKYQEIDHLISPLKNFIKYKRNNMIIIEFKNGLNQDKLAEKYNLSLRTIEEITRKRKK